MSSRSKSDINRGTERAHSHKNNRRQKRAPAVRRLVNIYQVRMNESSEPVVCFAPPPEGLCQEWLYLDSRGIPSMYWSTQTTGVLLI